MCKRNISCSSGVGKSNLWGAGAVTSSDGRECVLVGSHLINCANVGEMPFRFRSVGLPLTDICSPLNVTRALSARSCRVRHSVHGRHAPLSGFGKQMVTLLGIAMFSSSRSTNPYLWRISSYGVRVLPDTRL